ncbi:MAG: sulfatase-like hydrolase/transferase [Gammaproteobacteria bacterium]|nr:sulfatase-like hydrolase/transferase [Gammaproteobacteria bacterium]MBQ0841174.1 sulfatase-like hydrolase/transferase [Gammaproteobacteria bacterium]
MQRPIEGQQLGLRSHLAFSLLSVAVLIILFTLLRLLLLTYNYELVGDTPLSTFVTAFGRGLRFDLRVVAFATIPLVLAVTSVRAMAWRGLWLGWLTLFASVVLFFGALELDFYREFHQRLNSLVFQYLGEDPTTVLSMLWHGFPVLRYLLGWSLATWLIVRALRWCDRMSRRGVIVVDSLADGRAAQANTPWYKRLLVMLLCLVVTTAAARGTLRQGPPLRWGDAFITDSPFANQLALNGFMTLADAARHRWSSSGDNVWHGKLPADRALNVVREMLLTPEDQLVDADQVALRRIFTPQASGVLPIRNVVVILMESFAGRYVGALGSEDEITPYFDELAEQGLLFTNAFSNGTHTHQGMFATMACFPNLPGFEYLMQQPEGQHAFSGLPQLLSPQGFDDLYVYNGDFAWDNQAGFFANQGMTTFIGRKDFVNPVFSDPTWGVSDQDMFGRAVEEMANRDTTKPLYALLQTLSNHTPYALPNPLPVDPVSGHGSLDEHLTAMRYSDWALGQFFAKARQLPDYDATLFVILGDHGFGTPEQLTDIDLNRFNVPILLIGPRVQELFGSHNNITATQVDVVPTIMGRFGKQVQHQCWGRDLLGLPEGDPGVGVIKPSGSDQTVAIVSGQQVFVEPKGQKARLYQFQLGASRGVQALNDGEEASVLGERLHAFLQVATESLINNKAGAAPTQ